MLGLHGCGAVQGEWTRPDQRHNRVAVKVAVRRDSAEQWLRQIPPLPDVELEVNPCECTSGLQDFADFGQQTVSGVHEKERGSGMLQGHSSIGLSLCSWETEAKNNQDSVGSIFYWSPYI